MNKLCIFAKKKLIRIAENHDWVIYCLLTIIVVYIVLLRTLQREANLVEYVLQNYVDSSNRLVSWIIVSFAFILLLSILISNYIPIVPKKALEIKIVGYHLNKIGFSFAVLSLYYLTKTTLSYLFFQSVDYLKKWRHFYFSSTKYFFVLSIILFLLCFLQYYYPLDKEKTHYTLLIFAAFSIVFKLAFFTFNKNQILPNPWYYKFLYICTLQIIPLLVVWKVLFF